MKLKTHIRSLLQGDKPNRSRSFRKNREEEDGSDTDRRSRATTPSGRALLEEVSLKPVGERKIPGRLDPPEQEEKCELKNHFRDFMKTPALVKRNRSFSQPRDKEKGSGSESLSRKESFEHKYPAAEGSDQEKCELANHTERFLKRKSLINPNKMSDDSDTDSIVKDKPTDQDVSASDIENELDDSPTNIVYSKPPPAKTVADSNTYRRVRNKNGADGTTPPTRRFDRRLRSKSDITVPKNYFMDEEAETVTEEKTDNPEVEESETKAPDLEPTDVKTELKPNTELESNIIPTPTDATTDTLSENCYNKFHDRQRRRRSNAIIADIENVYLSTTLKVVNSVPKPFVASIKPTEDENKTSYNISYTLANPEKNFSRSDEETSFDNKKRDRIEPYSTLGYSSSTSDIMNACKSGLRRLTYRKTYSRSRSGPNEIDQDKNNNFSEKERDASPKTTYTTMSSGSRLPNRPTTPGPYLSSNSSLGSSLYTMKRPTTPGPFTRDSWKRTNQRFNYTKILHCTGRETYL